MRSMNTSPFMFRCMYNDILNVISTEARKSGSEIYDLFKLSQCLSLADLDGMLRSVCASLVSGRVQVSAETITPVQQDKEIFDQRYFEMDLSVSEVADQVGMSDSGLSRAFKAAYTIHHQPAHAPGAQASAHYAHVCQGRGH